MRRREAAEFAEKDKKFAVQRGRGVRRTGTGGGSAHARDAQFHARDARWMRRSAGVLREAESSGP